MNKLTEEQQAKGRARFLAAHPEIKRKIEALTQAEADAMCTTLEHLRVIETMRALSAVAYENRVDSQELFFSCVADTAEEFAEMVKSRDKAIQKAIGL